MRSTIEVDINLDEILSQFCTQEILELLTLENVCEYISSQLDTQELIEIFDIRALPQIEEMDEPELWVTLQKILKRMTNES